MKATLCFHNGIWYVQLNDEYTNKQPAPIGEGEATELAIEILKLAQDARTRQAKEPKKVGRNDY